MTCTITRRYRVCRTSLWDDAVQPCDEAFQVEVVNVDTRTADDPKKVPAFKGDDFWWYLQGTNHRVENGKIKRDMGMIKVWMVEIADIAAFVEKYGQCVVRQCLDGDFEIEIYDDWRE